MCCVAIVNKDICFPRRNTLTSIKSIQKSYGYAESYFTLGNIYKATPQSCIFTISLSLFVNAFRSSLFSAFLINLTVPQFFVLTRSTSIVRNLVNNLFIFHYFSFLKVGDVKIANLYPLSTDFINLIIEAIICTYSLFVHYINTYRLFA